MKNSILIEGVIGEYEIRELLKESGDAYVGTSDFELGIVGLESITKVEGCFVDVRAKMNISGTREVTLCDTTINVETTDIIGSRSNLAIVEIKYTRDKNWLKLSMMPQTRT